MTYFFLYNFYNILVFVFLIRAFTAVELVESQWAIKTGELKDLSVQELISCGAGLGCNGGNTCGALNWMIPNGPSNTSVSYKMDRQIDREAGRQEGNRQTLSSNNNKIDSATSK